MKELFKNNTTFNVDITDWDTSNVTNIFGMFWGASSFNQNLWAWDVGKINKNDYDTFSYIFDAATAMMANYPNIIPIIDLYPWSTNFTFGLTTTPIFAPDFIVTYEYNNSGYYEYKINGSISSIGLTKGNTYIFLLNIQDYSGRTNNGFKIVKTNNTSVLDWSSSTGNPGNKLTYLVTDGLSHSDGTTGDAANSGKTSGVLTYIVPSTVDANFNGNDNFIIGPWDSDKLTTNMNHQSIHRIYYN